MVNTNDEELLWKV